METRKRVLSGMRPTGRLHLGNYMGALKTWVELQQDCDCFFFVADWHALTSDYADPSALRGNMREMVMDWLAAGIDPQRSVVFVQSLVKEHAELALLLGVFTPLAWLERNPTYKEQILQLANKEIETYGFLGYPVLQAADILIYRADMVPVGEDQLPHLELTREIARRVNFMHGGPIEPGTNRAMNPIFPEPDCFLSPTPKLAGIDGRKMSKSYGNTIYLGDPAPVVQEKVSQMVTDPQRVRRKDPGHPEDCSVCEYHRLFTADRCEEIMEACRTAAIGCVDCKKTLAVSINSLLEPMRERRAGYEANPEAVMDVLESGTTKAREEAVKTIAELRSRLNLIESTRDLVNTAVAPGVQEPA
jgi:tryptophanyl-tRNA synthetase